MVGIHVIRNSFLQGFSFPFRAGLALSNSATGQRKFQSQVNTPRTAINFTKADPGCRSSSVLQAKYTQVTLHKCQQSKAKQSGCRTLQYQDPRPLHYFLSKTS